VNQAEIDARLALTGGGQFKLIDPKYAHNPKLETERLKERVKAAWKHREHFPDWLKAYVKAWSEATQEGRGKAIEGGLADALPDQPARRQ
jgi:hypothetical protein